MAITSASILASDFSRLADEIRRAEQAGVSWLHIDVMDGQFVENITLGAPVVKAIRKVTKMCFDTHLMVKNPDKQVEFFAAAGSEILTIHAESDCDVGKTLDKIKTLGMTAGLSVKPNTPAEAVFPYLEKCGLILVMTVEPGYGGQPFITEMTEKIRKIREEASRRGLSPYIEVDGGINAKTARLCRESGADVLVAGTFLFGASDMAAANKLLLGEKA